MDWFTRLMIGLIRLYQRTLSRIIPDSCRFRPSCSQYAIEAFQIHGPWRGLGLAVRRLFRCPPWNRGGEDRVPPVALRTPCVHKKDIS
jgi:putative membrane protein insertion efficiency factor